MGLISGLLTLPLAPVRGVVALADLIKRHAEQQYYDPALIRQQLEEVDEARRTGALDEAECDRLEDAMLERLMQAGGRARQG